MKPLLLFLVPLDEESSGGEIFCRRITGPLRKHWSITTIETIPVAVKVASCASRVLGRFACRAGFRRPATAALLALRHTSFPGPLLVDHECTRETRWLLTLRRWLRRPGSTVLVFHIDHSPEHSLAQHRRHQARRISGFNTAVSISQFSRAQVIETGFDADRVTITRPGLDTLPSPSLPFKSPVTSGRRISMLFVGNIQHRKGVDVLIAALADSGRTDVDLVLAGSATADPEYTVRILKEIAQFSLQSRVRMVGRLDEKTLERYWKDADVFILPSRMEGYGLVIVEAMLRGVPVICSRAGAMPELVEHGCSGLLVEADNVTELAQAINLFADNPKLRQSCAQLALERVRDFPDWEDTALVVHQVLRRAISLSNVH